jgi:hypothetical protein
MSLNLIVRMFFNGYGRIHPMIVAGTSPLIYIDLGRDEPGMKLQRWDGKCVNYKVNRKMVKSPVDIGALPPGRYRLV